MKILMNTQNYLLGGIPRVIKNMLLSKDDVFNNIHFSIVNLEDPEQESGVISKKSYPTYTYLTSWYDRSNFGEVISQVDSLDMIKNAFSGLFDMYTRILESETPDLVIVHGTGVIPWVLKCLAKERGLPVIIYYHGSLFMEEHGKIPGKDPLLKEFESSFFHPDFGYIFPSLFLKNTIVPLLDVADKIKYSTVIWNSVPDYFFEDYNKKRGKVINVAFIMRWSSVKNRDFVVRFVKYIQSQDLPYVVHIITDKIIQAKKSVGAKKVKFYTPLSHKKLSFFMRKMDILLCPSKFETYGNVAVEALATNTPVLVSKDMGVKGVLKHIGLEDCCLDFDSLSLKDICDIIDSKVQKKLSKRQYLRLHNACSRKQANKKRYNFIKTYFSAFMDKDS